MSVHDSTTPILPVVYEDNGDPVEVSTVFCYEPVYQVMSGPHRGLRGPQCQLREYCGEVSVAGTQLAVSCETGAILVHVRGEKGERPYKFALALVG